MKINGKEINFRLTVLAATEIADLCPDGDLDRLPEIMEGSFSKTARSVAKFVVALNRGYEIAVHGSADNCITENEILSLDMEEFQKLTDEAVASFQGDAQTEVKAKPKKKDEAKGEAV